MGKEKQIESIILKKFECFFSLLIDNYKKFYSDERLYVLLDDAFFNEFNSFLEKVDSVYEEDFYSLKNRKGSIIFISYFGEPIDVNFLNKIEMEDYHDGGLSINCLDWLENQMPFIKKEIAEGEEIQIDYIKDLIIMSNLEFYNKLSF